MADVTVSVARALTKLKLARAKITKDLEIVRGCAGLGSKSFSKLSLEKDLNRNHKEATAKVYSALQSIESLQSYIVTVTTVVQQSNLNTEINSDVFGKISIAAALVLTGVLQKSYVDLQSALKYSATAADMDANSYNNRNFSEKVLNSLTPADIECLLASPLMLVAAEDRDTIDTQVIAVREELNQLINESNAITMITIPDIQLL